MNRLQVKLFASFFWVILATVVVNAIYVKQVAEQEVLIHRERTERLNIIRMEHWLLGYHAHGGGWDDIAIYIGEMEVLSGQRVILTDEFGVVIADSYGEIVDEYFHSEKWLSRPLVHHRERSLLGMLYISPEPTIESEFARELTQSINKSLLIGSVISLALALLLTIILSRAIASPMKELSASAIEVGKGNFSHQVNIQDKGEFGELAKAFNRMAQDLSKASKARKNLVADIAHELRTPLTNIRGYTEAIRDNVVEPDKALQLVEEETQLLSKLIEDLQELALAEAGGLKLNIQNIDAASTVYQVVTRFEPLAQQKSLQLNAHIPKSPLRISADENRFVQMIQNLLTNAITHTPEGRGITISLQPRGADLVITVSDEGAGIDPKELEHIFERFYRTDPSRTRATGGTGLGLTITRYLTEAHGGTITAESRKGKGSRFTIVLPLANQSAQPLAEELP